MLSSGMLRPVALVSTDVSEECIVSIIRVKRIGALESVLAVTSNRSILRGNSTSPILVILMMEAIRSSETSLLTRTAQR
jgi:hypothetical protein